MPSVPPLKERCMRRSRYLYLVAAAGLLAVPAALVSRAEAAPVTPVVRFAALDGVKNANAEAAAEQRDRYFPRSRELGRIATPDLPVPGYLTPVIDPELGTKVTRVTDRAAMGVDLTGDARYRYLRNAYAKKQAWNSDGSRLLLGMTSPAPLLSGRTYRYQKMLDIPANATWSNRRPELLFGVRPGAGEFVSYDVTTETTRVEARFSGYRKVSLGDGEGNLSDDDRWVVLHATTAAGDHDMILFDRTTHASRTVRLGAQPNWIGMSHSGSFVVVSYNVAGTDADHGTVVFDRDLTFLRTVDRQVSHADLAYDTT